MPFDDPLHAFMPYPQVPVASAADGPLAGQRLAVKDLYDVAGYPTSLGSPLMLAASGIRTATAPLVEHLLQAGARFVGKTITEEFAFSIVGKNAHFGTPVNAAAPGRVAGGSSSGSAAAVAGGLADIALGSDTGGSMRAPGSFCGLFAIRPTQDRLTLEGVAPMASSFDTPGWFTRDVALFETVGEVLLGDDTTPLGDEPELLVADDLFAIADPAAASPLRAAVERAALRLGDLRGFELDIADIDEITAAFRVLQGREVWTAHGAFIERVEPPFGPGIGERFAFARSISDADVEDAARRRDMFRARLNRILGSDRVLVLPTVPDIAPLVAATDAELDDFRNRCQKLLVPGSLAGLPQVTIPVADKDGAPLGLSLLGPAGSDRALIALARRFHRAAAVRIA
ncbi:amidase [Chelatococcus sp. GCM10030263]|uniref:amidase n=1 Tax=Chelatococcus sp. GCM10030263 TaxID=3273387 RepID=UPI003617484C